VEGGGGGRSSGGGGGANTSGGGGGAARSGGGRGGDDILPGECSPSESAPLIILPFMVVKKVKTRARGEFTIFWLSVVVSVDLSQLILGGNRRIYYVKF